MVRYPREYKAELSLKDDKLSGYISCNDQSSLGALRRSSDILEEVAREEGLAMRKLDYFIQKKISTDSTIKIMTMMKCYY